MSYSHYKQRFTVLALGQEIAALSLSKNFWKPRKQSMFQIERGFGKNFKTFTLVMQSSIFMKGAEEVSTKFCSTVSLSCHVAFILNVHTILHMFSKVDWLYSFRKKYCNTVHNACWQNFRHFARLCIGKYIISIGALRHLMHQMQVLYLRGLCLFFSQIVFVLKIKSLFDEFKLISLIP